MRARFVVLLLAAGAGWYLLARSRDRPAVPDRPAVDRTAQGGLVDIDSARAQRRAILRRIEESGTYLGAMLGEMDSTLKRWPERRAAPIRVYLPLGRVAGYSIAFDAQVRRALIEWTRVAGIPVYFEFARDSTAAEVVIRWIERFPQARTGQADVVWNQDWWLVRGTLTLATHTPQGWPLDPDAVYTVALHEIGHLLGLGHSHDAVDVMSATTAVHDLTPRDKRTAGLLYALPPGPLYDPGRGPTR